MCDPRTFNAVRTAHIGFFLSSTKGFFFLYLTIKLRLHGSKDRRDVKLNSIYIFKKFLIILIILFI